VNQWPSLDSAGRTILHASDYRIVAIIALVACAGFWLLRKKQGASAPDIAEFLRLVASLFSIFGALTIGVVFLLTRPPAIELVSPETLAIVGVVVLISVTHQSGTDIWALLATKPKPSTQASPPVTSSQPGP